MRDEQDKRETVSRGDGPVESGRGRHDDRRLGELLQTPFGEGVGSLDAPVGVDGRATS